MQNFHAHERDEIVLSRETELAFRKRRQLASNWVLHAKMDEAIARRFSVSISACKNVLQQIVKSSLTGDFCTARQETLAEKSGVSQRTVVKAYKALRAMGLIYVKHHYRTNQRGEKRKCANYTLVAAFRKFFDKMAGMLGKQKKLPSLRAILSEASKNAVSAESASQFNIFNKALSVLQVVDAGTGEILTAKGVIQKLKQEFRFIAGGV